MAPLCWREKSYEEELTVGNNGDEGPVEEKKKE